jgi:twitching motility protein PilT
LVEQEKKEDWRGLDDDGRAFLAQALGEGAPVAQARATSATGALTTQPSSLEEALESPAGSAAPLLELLEAAIQAGASDLHLSTGGVPHLRVNGALRPIAGAPVSDPHSLEVALHSILTHEQSTALRVSGDLDLGFSLPFNGTHRRFRASMFRQASGLAAAIRVVPALIPPIEQLGLPPVVKRFVRLSSGLVIVTGPTGSGKSTTLAAMVEEINSARAAHIVTIEDPVEYEYTSKASVIHQREVGIDTVSFANALRHALRQDPDVILIGELRDLETIRIALTAAETGHVVFATLHSVDASNAVNRLIDVFPPEQQAQIRSQLALSLEGCLSQRLLPGVNGGLVAATEVLVATTGVRNLIREGKAHQVPTMLETGGEVGMHTFDQSLASLVQQGLISIDTARAAATATFGNRLQP